MTGILRLGFCDWETGREASTMGIQRLGGGFYDGDSADGILRLRMGR
jgi:hypothetical protein